MGQVVPERGRSGTRILSIGGRLLAPDAIFFAFALSLCRCCQIIFIARSTMHGLIDRIVFFAGQLGCPSSSESGVGMQRHIYLVPATPGHGGSRTSSTRWAALILRNRALTHSASFLFCRRHFAKEIGGV